MFRRHPVLTPLTVAYLLALAWLTLTPSSNNDEAFSLLRRLTTLLHDHGMRWLTFGSAEFLANIILFVPMGVFLVLLLGRRRWWLGVIGGVLASCWIELAQGVWLTTRVADPRDLVSNSIGTALGVLVALVITWPAARRHRVIARGTARQAKA